ncbi:MAG TPA: retropepsin-like aspartic protease [Allocoleopsis sp.]
MLRLSPRTGTLIALSGILALSSVACSSNDAANPSTPAAATSSASSSSSPNASPAAKSAASPSHKKTVAPAAQSAAKPAASPSTQQATSPTAKAAVSSSAKTASPAKQQATAPNNTATTTPISASEAYAKAIDIATGAVTISQSAVSREDWSLAASHWQQAIQLLKLVPASSSQHALAQQKLSQYQRFLAEAKQKATPPPKKTTQGDVSPQFFSTPIKGRNGGTPIIEVSFDGKKKYDMLFDTGATSTLITLAMAYELNLKPVGVSKSVVADGSVVALPIAYVKSVEIDSRLKRKMLVSIAPASMPIGLLGQDFFEGYEVTIKQNVIEFHRHQVS